ncbi:hypothetical protein Gotri_022837 [Gossypium trilobum]|uniref:Uncharacterized protein n=1 Tax=Gossypium trilobum TaxID=34281 RepID=A0A7J9DH44_9ROSI|nr:hypothetical protein [Gossypium trilobum]
MPFENDGGLVSMVWIDDGRYGHTKECYPGKEGSNVENENMPFENDGGPMVDEMVVNKRIGSWMMVDRRGRKQNKNKVINGGNEDNLGNKE